MSDLIEALQIFAKYVETRNRKYPTHCEHDELFVLVNPDSVSAEDIARLDELGFQPCHDLPCFVSYRFGSS